MEGSKLMSNVIDFTSVTESPAQVAVYIIDTKTGLGRRIYQQNLDPTKGDIVDLSSANPTMYVVNWIDKTITLVGDSLVNDGITDEELDIEVYEFGNGNQLIRSNSHDMALRIDPITENSEIHLGYSFNTDIAADPVVYHNGYKLEFNVDYYVSSTITGTTKLLFTRVYDPAVDYLSFVLFGSSADNISYSIPETQVFVYDGTTSFDLANYLDAANALNAIVEVNGYRLKTSDYSITVSTKILEVTATVTVGDIISATTFNDPAQQFLLTETRTITIDPEYPLALPGVIPIYFINTEKASVWIYTEVDLGFDDGTQVTLDGIVGTIQLNNNSYYVRNETDITYVEDGITYTYYVVSLYLNAGITKIVRSALVSPYAAGGFIWATNTTHQINQPDLALTNTARLHVTITTPSDLGGSIVSSDQLRLNTGNYLSILAPLNVGDTVTITSMVSAPTPGQMVYVNEVDKNGTQTIYRANTSTKTWLVQPLQSLDDVIYVDNIANVVDIVEDTLTVQSVDSVLYVLLKYDIQTIKQVTVYNITSITELASSDFILTSENAKPQLILKKQAAAGDTIRVTLRLGDVVTINGEKIRYKQVNYEDNSIKELTRGVGGTAISPIHAAYDIVYAISPTNTLFNFYYNRTWNSEQYNVTAGDPLQISDSAPAKFLQTGTK